MKSKRISKYFRQIFFDPNFNSWVEMLWKDLGADCTLQEYKERVIEAISVNLFDSSIMICREHLSLALEDVVCYCICNNMVTENGTSFMVLTDGESRALLDNKKIDKAFSSIIHEEEIVQSLNEIGKLSKSSDLKYRLLDGILKYSYYNACAMMFSDFSLSLEKAICKSMDKEVILGWINQIKENLFE
ncbi:MAG: hypothetical protein IKG42_01880 [Clostridia bacterium]|nr:hypothetical protein [Clostridia bacterium]